MKQLIKISAIFLGLMLNISVCAQMFGHAEIQEEPAPGRIETSEIGFVVDQMPYIPGGVTFTYPVGAFFVAPCVQVQATVPAQVADTMFIAAVSANSATDVTVIVYKLFSPGGVPTSTVEATLLDNVTVCLYATGI